MFCIVLEVYFNSMICLGEIYDMNLISLFFKRKLITIDENKMFKTNTFLIIYLNVSLLHILSTIEEEKIKFKNYFCLGAGNC